MKRSGTKSTPSISRDLTAGISLYRVVPHGRKEEVPISFCGWEGKIELSRSSPTSAFYRFIQAETHIEQKLRMLGSNPQPPREVRRHRLRASTPIPIDNKRMPILIEFDTNNGHKCIPHSTKRASSGTQEQIQDITDSDRGDKLCV